MNEKKVNIWFWLFLLVRLVIFLLILAILYKFFAADFSPLIQVFSL